MAARKTAKKAQSKKASTKKSVKPVRSVASSNQAELRELRAMKDDIAKGLAELKKERESFKREQHLTRINQEMAAGGSPPLALPPPQPAPEETPEQRVARQREEARAERRRKRLEEAKKVSSLDDARAKRSQTAPSAEEKRPVSLPMDELYKYKLSHVNRVYEDAVQKVKEPLVKKYNQILQTELKEAVRRDPECVAAQREQVMCVNELVELVDGQLPEGYAITELLTEKGLIVAQYVPDRAGKPLPLPEVVTPTEG